MPILFGTTIDSATYDKISQTVTCNGSAFADTQDPISSITVSVTGLGVWVNVPIASWSDTVVTGITTSSLTPNVTYDVRVVSSDGELAELDAAFTVSANFPVIDVGSSWKTVSNIYVNSGSTSWKTVTDMKVVVSGAWKSHV